MKINDSAIQIAFEISKWAANAIHGVQIPSPSIRKRIAGSSYSLSVDLYNCTVILASQAAESGVVALSRSVFENYARGFWASYVADEKSLNAFLEGRDKKTLDPLLRAIKKVNVAARKETNPAELIDKVKILDSFAHGGIRCASLREIGGSEIGSKHSALPYLLILAASTSTICVENFALSILDDKDKAAKYAEDGAKLMGKILHELCETANKLMQPTR